MEEEILEKRPTNPVESALLIIATITLIISIVFAWQELDGYLKGTQQADFDIDEAKRIESKYTRDLKIKKIRRTI